MRSLSIILSAIIMLSLSFGMANQADAYLITGGDAASQASANDLLDIVFVTDTSTSMNDEISTITSLMGNIVRNLDCPDCDVWVRARFFGITQTYGSLFDEKVTTLVSGQGGTPISNQLEDNGPAVTDLANWYNWNDDSTASQDYYKAIVTIGDEGTENGYPSDQADWDAAKVANQAALAEDIMVFSLVGTPWPSYTGNKAHRDDVFKAMAEGGAGGGHTFGDTGGLFMETTSLTLETDLEKIICTAGGGGTSVPEPATMFLLGTGLLGLVITKKRKTLKK